jgi:hypothetical protein
MNKNPELIESSKVKYEPPVLRRGEGVAFAHFILAFCMLAEILWIAFLVWVTVRALGSI